MTVAQYSSLLTKPMTYIFLFFQVLQAKITSQPRRIYLLNKLEIFWKEAFIVLPVCFTFNSPVLCNRIEAHVVVSTLNYFCQSRLYIVPVLALLNPFWKV